MSLSTQNGREPKDPLVILSRQMPWDEIETYLSQFCVRQPKAGSLLKNKGQPRSGEAGIMVWTLVTLTASWCQDGDS